MAPQPPPPYDTTATGVGGVTEGGKSGEVLVGAGGRLCYVKCVGGL